MILVLGGTSEARALARELDQAGTAFVSSLAGRVARPRLPVGPVRTGGFGGVEGLRRYLREEEVTGVVDATHPFAEGMTVHAAAACDATQVPLLRLERPGWADAPGSGNWYWVDTHAQAAGLAAQTARRPFLTVGRQALSHFVEPLGNYRALVRVVDEPDIALPRPWSLLLSRGPYYAETERALMDEYDVDAVVTKDSGGEYTWPKMAVAAQRGAAVIVVRRSDGPQGTTVTHDVRAAADWVDSVARDGWSSPPVF